MGLCSISQASHTHDAILEAAQLMKEAVDDIMVTLNEAASEVGMVGNMVDSIAEAMSKVSEELLDPLLLLVRGPCSFLKEAQTRLTTVQLLYLFLKCYNSHLF